MRIPHLLPCYAAAFLAVALVGCDAAETSNDLADGASVTEDAALSIANALAVESGGALGDVAGAVAFTDLTANRGTASSNGCESSRTYDDDAVTWTQVVACEHGTPSGAFYASFSRTRQFQFLDAASAPQPSPDGADALRFDLLEGTGERRNPVLSHLLTAIGASLTVDGLDGDRVTVNGTYTRSATDTLRTRRLVRTLDYTLELAFADVVGPRDRGDDGWNQPESGTVTGRYRADVSFETPGGYRDGSVDRTFTITFDGDDDATLSFGDDAFELDLEEGLVEGLDDDEDDD